MSAFVALVTAALHAWIAWAQMRMRDKLDEIEDEMDRCAADGSPAAKLRLERLAIRRRREQERTL